MMEAGTPEKVDLEPIGTGPFQFVAYQKDAVIRYKANPDYAKWLDEKGIDVGASDFDTTFGALSTDIVKEGKSELDLYLVTDSRRLPTRVARAFLDFLNDW